ncbi:MAG: ATP-binding protein, partial [Deltaproteobacteria bacterium]|nr:ATP-binding protein [Deltaproteobacteria bacterium]
MIQPAIKTFNTTGPCVPSEHYMLPVLPRQSDVDEMIEGKYYFILHAPRQSGKTTYLFDIVDKINNEGQYYALYCSLEDLN